MATAALPNDQTFVVPTYEGDYAGWAHHQAMLLRAGQLHLLDRTRIAEELDSLGTQEFNSLRSALTLILQHILKWDYQSDRRSRSWTLTIAEQRDRVQDQIDDSPSLKPRSGEALTRAYASARRYASVETGLLIKTFPKECPYDWDAVMTRPFVWPGDEE